MQNNEFLTIIKRTDQSVRFICARFSCRLDDPPRLHFDYTLLFKGVNSLLTRFMLIIKLSSCGGRNENNLLHLPSFESFACSVYRKRDMPKHIPFSLRGQIQETVSHSGGKIFGMPFSTFLSPPQIGMRSRRRLP